MAGLGQNEIRVIVRRPGKGARPLRYVRAFVGLTVKEAIERLDSAGKSRGGLPGYLVTADPYYLNGEEIDEYSETVLQSGDVLNANDP